MGRRPSMYSDELGAEICDRLINGESLRSVCKDGTGERMPSATTVFKWISATNTDKKAAPFKDMYDRACIERAEAFVEDIIEIADTCPESKEGVLKARLKTEVRKWHAEKRQPRKYGKQVDITTGGEKLGNIGAVVFEVANQQTDDDNNNETETAEIKGIETVSETSAE